MQLLYVIVSSRLIQVLILCYSHVSYDPPDRPSLPEQNAAQAQEATHFVHTPPDSRAREEVSQAKVPGIGRARCARQNAQDD